jgi:hypothetical protein
MSSHFAQFPTLAKSLLPFRTVLATRTGLLVSVKLLKLQAKKPGLGAAWGRCAIAVALVKGTTTVVKRLDHILAFIFVVVVLGKAI